MNETRKLDPTQGEPRPEQQSPFQHVLVPLDGSKLAERALLFASVAARGFGARTTLLQVLPPPAQELPVNPLEWERGRAQAQRYLEGIAARLAGTGLKAEPAVEQGRPAHRIIDYARDNEVDLIVLHSHGEGGPSAWQLSETAQLVVGSAAASVLVVPLAPTAEPDVAPQLRRLLVTLDCSPRAECVLPAVLRLGLATEAEILLCNVVEEPELTGRLGSSAEDVELVGRLVARNVQEATRYLERVRSCLTSAGVRCDTRLLTAPHAAEAIRDLAERERVDLVVSCAHGSGGRCREPHGSVAGPLAQRPTRPLLMIQDHPHSDPGRSVSPRRASLARGQ
jgi:nucleotide-binding universal stress UspA family protein